MHFPSISETISLVRRSKLHVYSIAREVCQRPTTPNALILFRSTRTTHTIANASIMTVYRLRRKDSLLAFLSDTVVDTCGPARLPDRLEYLRRMCRLASLC